MVNYRRPPVARGALDQRVGDYASTSREKRLKVAWKCEMTRDEALKFCKDENYVIMEEEVDRFLVLNRLMNRDQVPFEPLTEIKKGEQNEEHRGRGTQGNNSSGGG